MVTNPSCHLQIFGLCIKEQAWDQGVTGKTEPNPCQTGKTEPNLSQNEKTKANRFEPVLS
jgi:hypothetical protein